MSSLNKSTFFRAFLSYLPLIILFISVFNEFDFNYLKIENFSFYEYFINPDISDIDMGDDITSDKPDIESVPEKVVINE